MSTSYLFDTNIWLEYLLEQANTEIAIKTFSKVDSRSVKISEFSVHSIGVILSRQKKSKIFGEFLRSAIPPDSKKDGGNR